MNSTQEQVKSQNDSPIQMSDFEDGEVWNGRLAMIGFIAAIATEVLLGQSLLPKIF